MSNCPEGTEMRRYYGGIIVALIIDVVMIAAYFILRCWLEPAQARKRAARRKARFDASDEPMLDIAAEASALSKSLPKSDFIALAGSSEGASLQPTPSRQALVARRAKDVLESGFRDCNQGLRLDLTFEGLGLTLPPPLSKTILRGVRGRIRPGRVTAIMGPSGAGKTTFLSVLMGKVARTSGSLLINGREDDIFRFKKITGYVPQDDTMMRELTVRENILFSARMRLPRKGWTDARICEYVDAVIEVLGLTECSNTLIGDPAGTRGVSGGQRKRTNIGIELAAAPAAIFLDEPTSGLDSAAALEVCRTLRAIADLGLTVVAVIHQPRLEIFNSFDDLLLLAPGGVTAFIGRRDTVMPYFSDLGYRFSAGNNPADELLDFVAGEGGGPAGERTSPAAAGASDHDSSFSTIDGAGETSFSEGAGAARLLPDESSKAQSPGGAVAAAYRLLPAWAHSTLQNLTGVAPAAAKLTSLPDSSRYFEEQWKARESQFGSRTPSSAASPGASLSSMLTAPGLNVAGAAGSIQSFAPPPPLEHQASMPDAFDPVALSEGRGATLLWQIWLCHNRSVLQQYRNVVTYALEMGVGMLAGGMSEWRVHDFNE
jgi:ABC-type multidrug transport system ATPase subunit